MKLKLTPQFILAFLALTFIMHEAHEIVHTSVGRIICGCWGQRDFNNWGICEGCFEQHPISIISTFAGPIFSFLVIWIGTFLIGQNRTVKQKAMGFSLIFANLPFARILTAAFGGGDEVWGLSQILDNFSMAWATGLLFIVSILIIPLKRAFKLIENRRRIGWFLIFFLLPTFIDLLLVLGVLNSLLERGVLSDYWILGSPIIVTVWTILVTTFFSLTKKNIYRLVENQTTIINPSNVLKDE